MKRPFGEAMDEAAAEPWWTKRGPAALVRGDESGLLRLLAEKGRRNGELRAEAERSTEALLVAREDLRAAHEQIATLSERVARLQAEASQREQEQGATADAAAWDRAVRLFAERCYKHCPGKRGKAKRGEARAGWPTCETVALPLCDVPLLRRAGIEDPYELKLAIVALKSPNVAQAPPELCTVSAYQARDALLAFRMRDAPWKRGCVASFLQYMDSQEFGDSGARDRRHWLCMKLWPGRFGTPHEYQRHEACMSKAGKFITSIGKLRAVCGGNLADPAQQKEKGVAL